MKKQKKHGKMNNVKKSRRIKTKITNTCIQKSKKLVEGKKCTSTGYIKSKEVYILWTKRMY